MKCWQCGKEISENAKFCFCPWCGAPQSVKARTKATIGSRGSHTNATIPMDDGTTYRVSFVSGKLTSIKKVNE